MAPVVGQSSDAGEAVEPTDAMAGMSMCPEEGKEDEEEDEDYEVNEIDQVFRSLWRHPTLLAKEDRVLYLSRHGESEFNLFGKIGGNPPLSVQGEKYAAALGNYFNGLCLPDLQVWTSELLRTHQTAHDIHAQKIAWPQLNEVNAGDCDGLTYEEVAQQFPVEFARRDQDKLRYRYPHGESYLDVCRRLAEILLRINESENLLIVSHQGVIRCIVAFLTKRCLNDLPYIRIPLHTVIKVSMINGSSHLEFIRMAIDCVDTYRAKPTNCSTDRTTHDALVSVPFHL